MSIFAPSVFARGKASGSPSDDHEIRRIHQAHLTRDWSGTAPVA
jgi:hypothetical protein